MGCNSVVFGFGSIASSETQEQIVGARESLNGQQPWGRCCYTGKKEMTRRKVKNEEESPWGQCFTRPVPDSRGRYDLESGLLDNKPHLL